ncbi:MULTISPECIES: GDSL-type esterase/lipase family protein [Shouchella]|uniref:GDSL-type esterase/lipase family protein n=1 Tax=Shouchella hunanensis TaxID=766894 RepID=A0ABY7W138_9BACI|nr:MULTISPECIES: GDSL-type esterase/lipase family protein [Shouchella]WDF02660.1 GDSL-type esterase/lipase family protein [Shouchella hunanensis]
MERRGVNYLAIGDSLTTGVGASGKPDGFVSIYRHYASGALQAPVKTLTVARSGLTTGQIHRLVYQQPVTSITEANFITITGGGNDLIQSVQYGRQPFSVEKVEHAIKNAIYWMTQLVSYITEIKRGKAIPYKIIVFNSYNPLDSVPFVDQSIKSFNRGIQSLTRFPHVQVVDVYQAFKRRNHYVLSRDAFHPNNKGYSIMANEAAKKGFQLN